MKININYPIDHNTDYVSYECTLELKLQNSIDEMVFMLTRHVDFNGAILSISMVKSAGADKLLDSISRPKSNKDVFNKTFDDRISHLKDSVHADYFLVCSLMIPKVEVEKDEARRKTIDGIWGDLTNKYRHRPLLDAHDSNLHAAGTANNIIDLMSKKTIYITPRTENPKQVSAVDFLSQFKGACVLTQSYYFDKSFRDRVARETNLRSSIFSVIYRFFNRDGLIDGIENEWIDGNHIIRSTIFATVVDEDMDKLFCRVNKYFIEKDYASSVKYSTKTTKGYISSAWSNRYVTFHLPYKGNARSGVVLSSKGGQLSLFDMFNSHSNYNVAIAGGPASGTDHTVKEMMFSHLAGDGYCWCLDSGGSFEQFCKLVDGRRWEVYSEGGINPFSLIKQEDDSDCDYSLHWLKIFLFRLSEVDDEDRQVLSSQIDKVWFEKRNDATISDLVVQLSHNSHAELAEALAPYAEGGEWGQCFKWHVDQIPNSGLVLFDLQWKAPDKIVTSVNAVLLRAFQLKIMSGPRERRSLVVQLGFPAMFRAEDSCEDIDELMRCCRRYRASAMIVAPSLIDLFSNRVAMSIFYNSSFTIIQPQKDTAVYDNASVVDALQLSEADRAALKASRVMPGHYIDICLLEGKKPEFVRFNTDPVINSLYSYSSPTMGENYD